MPPLRAVDEARPERTEAGDSATSGEPPAPARRRTDVWAYGSYLFWALVVLSRLWLSPSGRVLKSNPDDHGFFMFAMAHGERVLFHGANPFFENRLNVPGGVNMMATTSVLALSIPFAPLTHFFGPGLTVVLLLTLGLAGTASAW